LGKKVTSSDESILKATANNTAVEGRFEIVVKQLARGVTRNTAIAVILALLMINCSKEVLLSLTE